jgi:glutamyl-tRNA reductase
MNRFNVLAFTHSNLGLDEIGRLHLELGQVVPCMNRLKNHLGLNEIMYLSTCNRVEFVFVTDNEVNDVFIGSFLQSFNSTWDQDVVERYVRKSKSWNGINAVNHLIEVASSVDSMVLGEREIITQVRMAYDFSKEHQLSGDMIRVVIRQTIETAKKVYTETSIATKPVSVVSLAFYKLKEKNIPRDARIIVVGSGATNTNMCRFLIKEGYHNFTIYNRTVENAEELGRFTGGAVRPLSQLAHHQEGFDILVSCTASSEPVITPAVFKKLTGDEKEKKVVVDLAIPADVDPGVLQTAQVEYIGVSLLKTIADVNLHERRKELIRVRQIIYESVEAFKEIFRMRQVELKMRAIPERVKEIRSIAVNEVFSRELSQLDPGSKEVLEKILNYMEKKYIGVPMLIAKELFAKTEENQV